ncbi:pyruvate kinase [Thermodesulfitimonas autotrophica]|uniref:Pyruvate kinase n=1 Tax=Thermodesulfitimonas autotrophica TaxID=1894989 RepID=A0A3N5AY48_9THEO|nr:pyruvate kinase [Thermodesulfitimonas autotrophica]RPF49843.1 pyruvate kinase [Thermodesulfitimonas autotrophica]
MRHTKIVCTIGPASEDPAVIEAMLRSGMNVARINMSHGTQEEHRRRLRVLRAVAAKLGQNLGILLDIRGPRIRIGDFETGPFRLETGEEVELIPKDFKGTRRRIPVNYEGLVRDVKPGNIILVADGLVSLRVLNTTAEGVLCRVETGGEVSARKGVNLPGVKVNLPSLTEKDVADIRFGIAEEVDFIALSFVRRAEDVLAARRLLEEAGADISLIAKIENWEGLENLGAILKVADGVMVARGDLGLEIPTEEVPLAQKRIIEEANAAGKPVITATQMLESMIHNSRPTRAEASDVANAIFDGTDAVMLSGETAIGRYPVEAVAVMARIAARTEEALPYGEFLRRQQAAAKHSVTDAISFATCTAAEDLGAAAIITATQTGYTARMVAKYRPRPPVVAVTPHEKVVRRLALVWGVFPLLVAPTESTDQMIKAAVEAAVAAGYVRAGDLLVITAGVPVGVHGTTNLLKVHTVGNVVARGVGVGTRAVSGPARVVHTAREALERVQSGDILVAPATDKEYIPALERAAGVVTETGGMTSHAAIVGLEFGIPVVVGVEGATAIIKDGALITLDPQRGVIYSGVARVL